MPKTSKKSIKSIISTIGSSLSSFFKEALKFITAIFVNIYAKLKSNSKQIFAALVILFACWVLSYSLIISATLAFSYILYAISAKTNNTRVALAKDTKHQGKLAEVKAFSSDNGLETLAYRVYGYFLYKRKSEQGLEPSDSDKASLSDIRDKFVISSSVSESGVNALFATPKNDDSAIKDDSAVVAFRGTDPSDPDETVLADFEENGPGFMAYLSAKEALFAKAKDDFAGRTTVDLTGHSFGGGISQMFAADLLTKIADGEEGYAHITNVNLAVFQSTGVHSSYSVKAKEALVRLADNNPDFKFNMAAHCYEGDIVHASAPYLMSDVNGPSNTRLYLVYKHMTLWVFLTTLFSNIFSAHSLPFYSNQGKVDSDIIANANLRAPMQVYSSSDAADQRSIRETYQADYMRFLSNGVLHKWLSYIGISRLKLVRDIIFFTLAVALFALKLSAFIALPTLLTYGVMLVSLVPLLQTIYAPSLAPIRDKIAEWFINAGLKLSKVTSKLCSACSLKPRSAPAAPPEAPRKSGGSCALFPAVV